MKVSKASPEVEPYKYPPLDPNPYTHVVSIKVAAKDIIKNDDGTFDILLEGKELSKEQHKVLDELFPTLYEEALKLLHKELLVAAMQ